ncbi:MAG: DUF2958 domain-containing protein [Thermotogota bacterium]|nr:DUF2958 domain-containing protein [Thermotogota bacterium]
MKNEPTREELLKLPRVMDTAGVPYPEKMIYIHFSFRGCSWYIAEYDDTEEKLYGFGILNNDFISAEWGYVSFNELRKFKHDNQEIARDPVFTPKPAKEIDRILKCPFAFTK